MTSQCQSSPLHPIENQSDRLLRVIDSTTVDVHQRHLMFEAEDDSWLMFDGQQALVERLEQASQGRIQHVDEHVFT